MTPQQAILQEIYNSYYNKVGKAHALERDKGLILYRVVDGYPYAYIKARSSCLEVYLNCNDDQNDTAAKTIDYADPTMFNTLHDALVSWKIIHG